MAAVWREDWRKGRTGGRGGITGTFNECRSLVAGERWRDFRDMQESGLDDNLRWAAWGGEGKSGTQA